MKRHRLCILKSQSGGLMYFSSPIYRSLFKKVISIIYIGALGFFFASGHLACSKWKGKVITQQGDVFYSMSGAAPYDGSCQGEGNCECSVEVNKIIDGYQYNTGTLNYHSGGNPENVFLSGGSENIPITCNTGLYLDNNRKEWLLEYFNVQKRPDIGFSGHELFSAGYMQQTLGYILTVHNHAIERGHSDLEAASSEWLRAYWAFLTLASSTYQPPEYSYTLESGISAQENPGRGMGLATVGTRNYVNQMRGVGLQHIFLAIALDTPGRHWGWNLNHSPGANGGLRAFLRKIGYYVSDRDGSVSLTSKSATARQVGLTEQQRSDLNQFVQSNGTQKLSEVLALLAPYKLACSMTFIRTSSGVMTWFGTSSGNTPICTTAKGGAYNAVKIEAGNPKGEILARVVRDNTPGWGETWRNGSRICANSTDLPTECIDIPGGNLVYEISFEARQSAKCIAGSCSGSQPPVPTPPQQPTPTPAPAGGSFPPEPTAVAQCGVNALCLHNGRYQVMASWLNQFNNSSGTAQVINHTNFAGFLHFGDPSNIELMVKVLSFGGTIKVFYGQLTNLKFTLRVRDTHTGTSKIYHNTAGDCGGIDQNAFVASLSSRPGAVDLSVLTSIAKIEKPFLPDRSVAFGGSCIPNANTLCLQNNRIKVSATWRNHYNSTSGIATVGKLSNATGGLYFTDSQNLELLVKALDFGTHFLVMYGAMSDLEYNMTVTDTVTGISKTFVNSAGNYCGGLDSQTFSKN